MDSNTAMHAWMIPDREYARQEARRGRRHAYARLDPRSTALVVIDMVPFFVNENPYCRGIVPNIRALASALRAAGGLVSWVLPAVAAAPDAWQREFFGDAVAALYNASGGAGPLRSRLCPAFEVAPADLVAEKTAASAFFPGRSPLPAEFARRGIRTVIVTGTVTNVCCESSARDASTLGHRVIMVADANAAVNDAAHNATLLTIYRTFGDVRTTAETLALIRADADPDTEKALAP
jgi:nicotinamidase-related amidase